MEQILQAIKAKIEECKRTGNSFSMPNFRQGRCCRRKTQVGFYGINTLSRGI